VKVTVAIVTYRWAWALPHSLASIVNQTKKPEDVVIALKPSGDGSEEVIRSLSSQLPIKLVVQVRGTSQTRCRWQ
jgi:GT2 family glycosyltransferase